MEKYESEKQMIKVGVLAFALISAGLWLLYSGVLRGVPNIERYGIYLVYTAISTTVIGVGIWHVKAYRHTFTCSTGMMAGMTIGMLAGFLLGAIIGATNGLFTGSVYGMFLGMFTGAWCTRNCGIMSIMEGLMAGLMGGLMGAMTTVMMINDNLAIFMPILVGSITFIMAGMNVMIYQESEEHRDTIGKKNSYEIIVFLTFLLMLAVLTTIIMVYGPKSALVAL